MSPKKSLLFVLNVQPEDMHLKIYFNDKPLFLANEMDEMIRPYSHHDDAVLIDEFSNASVNSMIHEMRLQKIHAGIFLHADLEQLKKAVFKKFTVIQAAGGWVMNDHDEVLMIHRRGKWDLPKGKLDPGETLEDCAVRETTEETGVKHITAGPLLLVTYHTYEENGHHILKESYWYDLRVKGRPKLTPQKEEDIAAAEWVPIDSIDAYLKNTFPSIVDVARKVNGE